MSKTKLKTIFTCNPEETQSVGRQLGALLVNGDVVLLTGELGAGKTTFAQGICQGLGVGEDTYVRSPTFTLINEYLGRVRVRHIDLYRIDTKNELDSSGLFDSVFDGVTLIEWAEKLPMEVASRFTVDISDKSETQRVIMVGGK